MNASKFDTSTPEKLALFNAMQAANATLSKVAKRNPLAAFRSPEYKAAKTAYRAYWDLIDGRTELAGIDTNS